jgi:hypothetical protein
MSQAIDGQNPFAHVPSDPNLQPRRRRNELDAVTTAELTLRMRR